jgi:signal transduction histidine kinase
MPRFPADSNHDNSQASPAHTVPRHPRSQRAPQADSQVRAATVIAAIRLAAGASFLGVGAAWTLTRRIDLGFLLFPMLAYVGLAAATFAGRHRPLARRLAFVMPFFDVALAFVVLRQGITSFPTFAASWAVSGLGIYTLVVALAGLSLPVRMTVVLTLLSAAAEGILLRAPGITLWPMLVATSTLAFVAVATSAVPRMAAAAFRQEGLAAITLDSLEKAREQNRQLELLQREKDALLEIIVHDMRNPVGAAMLSLEYIAIELKKHPSQATLLEANDDALATLSSLSSMISQILDTSKLESGRLTLRLDNTELRPVLAGTLRGLAPRAAAKSIAVELEAPEGLVAALDARLFPRALESLASHLLRHTPEGGRIALVTTGDGREVRVSFHSSAPAVPPAERGRIFDKFPFAGGETRRLSGWGLGLYFCRLVAEFHQGSLSLEEVAGWSTSFVLRLPAQASSP